MPGKGLLASQRAQAARADHDQIRLHALSIRGHLQYQIAEHRDGVRDDALHGGAGQGGTQRVVLGDRRRLVGDRVERTEGVDRPLDRPGDVDDGRIGVLGTGELESKIDRLERAAGAVGCNEDVLHGVLLSRVLPRR